MRDLIDAVKLATAAHTGQLDKQGEPYILHPLRVMVRVRRYATMPLLFPAEIVAVLHDTIEDTPLELIDLDGFHETVIGAVSLLTRVEGQTWKDYIQTICMGGTVEGVLARIVKLADLEDNMDPARQTPETSGMVEERYKPAYEALLKGSL